MSIQNIVIKDSEGETIVQKSYITEVTQDVDQFLTGQITSYNISIPICLRNRGQKNVLFVHYKYKNMHLFVQLREGINEDVMSAVYFLQETCKALEHFIGRQLSPKVLKENMLLVIEILGELVDSGEIQTTDPQILALFIQDGNATIKSLTDAQVTIQVTKTTAYRPQGITYTKNELFVDINETLNCIQDQAGNLLSSDVRGELTIKSKLSGMPDCSMQLNDRLSNVFSEKGLYDGSQQLHSSSIISLDGVFLHHCARSQDFIEKRQLNFIPPDGQFTLMRYAVGRGVSAPLTVRILYSPTGKNEARCVFSLRPRYTTQHRIERLKIKIPLPPDTVKLNLKAASGQARQSKCGRFIEWLIKSLPGGSGTDVELETEFKSHGWDPTSWKKPNVIVSFQLENLLASGVEVLGIKILSQEGYDVQKWLKAKTVTGDYVIKW